MMQRSEELLAEAAKLPAEDRSRMATRLMESLDNADSIDPLEWERQWSETCEQRNADIDNGTVKVIPGEEALERLRRKVNEFRQD